MLKYGVRKIIAIESGLFDCLEMDLSLPLHLHADNNSGKTSFVNMLQFLYIDKMIDMSLPGEASQDSLQFYFPGAYSFMVFECETAAGLQCVVLNRPDNLSRNKHYHRYVYTGEYKSSDYFEEDNGRRSWHEVLEQLALSQIKPKEIKNTELWQVLSGKRTADKQKLPSLGILLLRDKAAYTSFKSIFTGLLSMKLVDDRKLKEIIIGCLEDGDTKEISLAQQKDYLSSYESAEKKLNQVDFVKSATSEIEQALINEEKVAEAEKIISTEGVGYLATGDYWLAKIDDEIILGNDRYKIICDEIESKRKNRSTLDTERGVLMEKLADIKRKIVAHENQAQDSNLQVSIEQGLEAVQSLFEQSVIALNQHTDTMKKVTKLSLNDLLAQKISLEASIQAAEQFLNNTESSLIGRLHELGLSDEECDSLSKIASHKLLEMTEGFSIKGNEVLEEIRRILTNVKGDQYLSSNLDIELHGLPNKNPLLNLDQKRAELTQELENLERLNSEIEIARDQEKSRLREKELRDRKDQHAKRLKSLEKYLDNEKLLPEWKVREAEFNTKIEEMSGEIKTIISNIEELENQASRLQKEVNELRAKSANLNTEYQAASTALKAAVPEFTTQEIPVINHSEVLFDSCVESLLKMKGSLKDKKSLESNLDSQKRSLLHRFGSHYDGQLDWQNLIEYHEGINEMESTLQKDWEVLFNTASNEFNQFCNSVVSVRSLVNKLNKTLRENKVSNLEYFEIKVETTSSFSNIQPFLEKSEEDLFYDAGKRTSAWRELSDVFRNDRALRLTDLFALQIEIIEPGKTQKTRIDKLDDQSTGTNYTAKAVILSRLLSEQMSFSRIKSEVHFHYYLDEISTLDENNLGKIIRLGIDENLIPITAAPQVVIDPLCQPACRVVGLYYDAEIKKSYSITDQSFDARKIDE